jgi:heat shock protein HslJ/uncharacterized lipoprotein YbaY
MCRHLLAALALAFPLSFLSGCERQPAELAGEPASDANTAPLTITGELSYRVRIALHPESTVVVALRDATDAGANPVAEQRIELEGRQVPIAFRLVVDRAALDPDRSYSLGGTIYSLGAPAWRSESITIDTSAGELTLGTLLMQPHREAAPAAVTTPIDAAFDCGEARVIARFAGAVLQLTLADETIEMRQSRSASGARYVSPDDPATLFWNKGDRATLEVRGLAYPECVEAPPGPATGSARAGTDNTLLGEEWVVEDIDARGIIDRSRATLAFGADGTLGGRSSCNSYSGGYTLTDQRLTVGQLATTMMACAEALMNQERLFLEILMAVESYSLSDDGALILSTADGRTLKARRERA